METTLHQYYQLISEQIRNRLILIRKLLAQDLSATGEIGARCEEAVRDFLRDYLPRRFEVGSGIILQYLPTGEPAGQSAQTDVVIHDSFNFPPFLRAGHFVITIAAAVCGVMEIKARLTREQLGHAAENIQRARVLNQGQTRGFVLGFEGDSPAVLREELARLDEEFRETPHLLIDGVFVLDHQWGIKRYPARDEYEGAEAFMRFYADLLEALTDFTGIHYGQFPYMAVQSPSAARFPSAGESP